MDEGGVNNARRGSRMAVPPSTSSIPVSKLIPAPLFNACFVLLVIHAAFFPTAYFAHWWIYGADGSGSAATGSRHTPLMPAT